jgi:hypothetical protein
MTSQFELFYAPYLAACAAVFAFVAWTGGRAVTAFLVGACAALLLVIPMQIALASAALVTMVVALIAVANARFADPREWGAPSFLFSLLAGGIVLAVQPYLPR